MRVLVFSPFQAIEHHAFSESFFAKTLKEQGHSITYLTCDGLLKSFCVSQSAYGLRENSSAAEKEKVCRACRANKKMVRSVFEDVLSLEEFYEPKFEQVIEEETKKLEPSQLYDYQYNGYPVGRIAAYEFILHYKIFDMAQLGPELFEYYKINFANTLRILASVEKLLTQRKFDRVLLYNAAYSANNMVRTIALKHSIPVCFMHGGYNIAARDEAVFFSFQRTMEFIKGANAYFIENQNSLNLDYEKYFHPLNHFREQLKGRSIFTYSSVRDGNLKRVCENLGIDSRYKKIALASLSSSDELYAADFSFMEFKYMAGAFKLFGEQTDWVRKLIAYFKVRPEYKLIIRVHPREFPNKRENIRSPKVAEYEAILKDLPHNIVVDYPSMQNSIYDLFDLIDLHLVAPSTVGCESAMLGIPGVGCFSGIGLYPIPAINPVPQTEAEYFKIVESTFSGERTHSVDTIRKTLQWYVFLHNNMVINFEAVTFWNEVENSSLLLRILRKMRKGIGVSRYSLTRYLNSVRISENEKKVFLTCVEQAKEIYTTRQPLPNNNLDKFFPKYLVELFSIFYGVDLSKYQKCTFTFTDEQESLFDLQVKEEKESIHIAIPKMRKVARALAQFICNRGTDYSQLGCSLLLE